MKVSNKTTRLLLGITSMAAFFAASSAFAANDLWIGNSDANFGTLANWTGSVTPNGNTPEFHLAGSSGTTLTNDISGATYNGFLFDSGSAAFTIGGNPFTLGGNLANNSTSLQTISSAITNTAIRTVTLTTGGGNITLGGNITGTGGGFTLAGTGTLALSGSNSFTGGITVGGKTLQLQANTANSASGISSAMPAQSMTLAQLGSGSTIQLRADSGVASGGIVAFNNGGTAFGVNSAGSRLNGTLNFDVNQVSSGSGLALQFGSPTATWNLGTGTTTFNVTGGNSYALQLGNLTVGNNISLVFNPSTANMIVGTIGNATTGSVTKNGAGTLTMNSGANDYSGATILAGGVLSVSTLANGGTVSGLGKSANTAGNLIISGGTLQYTGPAVSCDRLFQINSGGATFDASGSGAVNFSNTGQATYSNNNQDHSVALTGTNTAANTMSVVLPQAGTGVTTVTKTGTGYWAFGSAQLYTGSTLINAGVLALAGSGSLLSTNINVGVSGTLDVTTISGGTMNLISGQALSGNGTVLGSVNTGSGTLLPGGAGVAGTLTVGDLALSSSATHRFDLVNNTTVGGGVNDLVVVAGNLDISSGGTPISFNFLNVNPAVGTYTLFQYNTFSGDVANVTLPTNPRYAFVLTNDTDANAIKLIVTGTSANLVWLGDGSFNGWDNAGGYQNWTNSAATSQDFFFDGDSVTFNDTGSGSPAINLTTVNSPGSLTVNATQNYDFTGSGGVAGVTGLSKSGSGTLILETTNSYAGPTIVNNGTLQIGNGGSSGTLGLGPVTNNGTLSFNRNDGVTVPNDLHGAGSFVVNSGSVTPTSAGSDYTGNVAVNGGILFVSNTNALGTTAGGTTVGGGGQVYITANVNFGAETMALNGAGDGNGALRKGGSGATTYSGAVTLASDSTIGVDGGATLTLSNQISGPAALTKIGNGTLVLSSSNSYSGITTVNGGVLTLNNTNALGTSTQVNVSSTTAGALGGTRITLGAGVAIPSAVSLSLPCVGTTARSVLYAAGASSWNGPITLNGDGTASPGDQIAFAGADGLLTIGGTITGNNFPGTLQLRGNGNSGAGGLINGSFALADNATVQVNDATTWTIASTGNTWGISEIASGTLRVGANNALPASTIVKLGAAGNGTLDLNGFNQQVAALAVVANTAIITNSSAASDATLTFATNGGASYYSEFIGSGVRKLNLALAAGTLTLSNAASLNISNSTVSVASGAVLDLEFTGTNTVAGFVTNGISAGPGLYNAATSSPYLAGMGYLLVPSSGPSGPEHLTNSYSGGVLSLSWPAGEGWRLQMQTNSLSKGLSTNWDYITDGTISSTNITVDATKPAVFYRLANP